MKKNIYLIYTVPVSISNLSTVMDRRQLRTVFSKDFGVNKLQSVFFMEWMLVHLNMKLMHDLAFQIIITIPFT